MSSNKLKNKRLIATFEELYEQTDNVANKALF